MTQCQTAGDCRLAALMRDETVLREARIWFHAKHEREADDAELAASIERHLVTCLEMRPRWKAQERLAKVKALKKKVEDFIAKNRKRGSGHTLFLVSASG